MAAVTAPVLNVGFTSPPIQPAAAPIILPGNVATDAELNAVLTVLVSTAGVDMEGSSAASQAACFKAFAFQVAHQGASGRTLVAGSFNLEDVTPAPLRNIPFARIATVIKMTPCATSDSGYLTLRRFCARWANQVYMHFRDGRDLSGTAVRDLYPRLAKPYWPATLRAVAFDFAFAIGHPDALPLPAAYPDGTPVANIQLTDLARAAIDANARIAIGRSIAQAQRLSTASLAHEYNSGRIAISQ